MIVKNGKDVSLILKGTTLVKGVYIGNNPIMTSPIIEVADKITDAFGVEVYNAAVIYAWNNPFIVPYILEDFKVVCSLPLGVEMPIRTVNGGGTGYFRTGVYDVPCDTTRFVYKYRRRATNDQVSMGNRLSYGSKAFLFTFTWNSPGNCGWNYGNGYTEKNGSTITVGAVHTFDMDGTTGNLLVDGSVFMSRGVATRVVSQGQFLLMGVSWNASDTATSIGSGDFAGGEMYIQGELAHWYIPIERNGEIEMIDLVTGNLIERVGTFTEAFFYTDGTEVQI